MCCSTKPNITPHFLKRGEQIRTPSPLKGPCKCKCHNGEKVLHAMDCCCYVDIDRDVAKGLTLINYEAHGIFRIGVIGPSLSTPDEEILVAAKIKEMFDEIHKEQPDTHIAVVAKLTNNSLMEIVYQEATSRDWMTIGIATPTFPGTPTYKVDAKAVIGRKSEEFVTAFASMVDGLISIGQDNQSAKLVKKLRSKNKFVRHINLQASTHTPIAA